MCYLRRCACAGSRAQRGGQLYALALVRRRLQLQLQLDCGQLMRVVASAERRGVD
jgi:hypothetical protein